MQFVVPQFIDVESKIIGPVSTRQFIIVLVGGGILYLEFQLILNTFLFIVAATITAIAFIIFAFAKVNGQSMHYVVLNFIQTMRRPRLRLWRRLYSDETITIEEEEEVIEVIPQKKSIGSSRLSEISLLVDTGGGYKPGSLGKSAVSVYEGDETEQTHTEQKKKAAKPTVFLKK